MEKCYRNTIIIIIQAVSCTQMRDDGARQLRGQRWWTGTWMTRPVHRACRGSWRTASAALTSPPGWTTAGDMVWPTVTNSYRWVDGCCAAEGGGGGGGQRQVCVVAVE